MVLKPKCNENFSNPSFFNQPRPSANNFPPFKLNLDRFMLMKQKLQIESSQINHVTKTIFLTNREKFSETFWTMDANIDRNSIGKVEKKKLIKFCSKIFPVFVV